jgi:TonB family protein
VRPTTRLAALLLVAGGSLAAGPAAPKSRLIDCWVIAPDARLELRAYARGTPAPLELRVERASKGSLQSCGAIGGDAATALPALGDPLPAAVRVEWTAARDWSAAVRPLWAPDDSARWAGSVSTVPRALRGVAGEVSITPVRAAGAGSDSARLQLRSGTGAIDVAFTTTRAWALVWALGEQANVLDPDGRADYGAVLSPPQVDRPVTMGRNPTCQGKYPEWEQRIGRSGVVHMQFVVGTGGRAERGGARVLGASPGDDFERAALDLLACLTYRPAELRGRRVRLLVQQPFEFNLRVLQLPAKHE